MKKQYILLAACLAVAACAKEGIEPDYVPEYYTFKAVFDEETKMDFGDPAAGKIALQWKTGDEVGFTLEKSDDSKVTRKGTIAVEGETVTVTMDLNLAKNGWESIQDIWYPYNGGTKLAAIPTSQSYDCVAVPVQKTAITASTVTFATYLPYVVLEFPVTQRTHTLPQQYNRATYLPKSTRLNSITLTTSSTTYELNTSADPAINLKTLYESVTNDELGNAVITTTNKAYYMVIAPITSETITVKYTTEDDISFSNSKGGLTLATKAYRKMPEFDLTGYHFWRFGASFTNSDCNGMVYWMRDLSGDGKNMVLTTYTSGDPAVTSTYLNRNAGSNYMSIYPYNTGSGDKPYVYDFGPLWGLGHFCSDGSAGLTFNTGQPAVNQGKMTLSSKYPVLAIAMDRPKALANYSTYQFIMEPGDLNQRTIFNEDGDEAGYNAAKVLLFTQLDASGKILYGKTIAGTTRNKVLLRMNFSDSPASGPELKVYWAGTFRSADDAKAYFKKYSF